MAGSAVFAKMNLKDQQEVVVLSAPKSFETEIARLDGVRVRRKLAPGARVEFGLAFVTSDADVDAVAAPLAIAAAGDAIVWVAYPKGTSKKYTSTVSRDSGWKALGNLGFEPVRMVAIDEDWTAVRFRRAEYIKTMTRGAEHAMSKAGRVKAGARPRKPRASRA
jgi:hypothetical protein